MNEPKKVKINSLRFGKEREEERFVLIHEDKSDSALGVCKCGKFFIIEEWTGSDCPRCRFDARAIVNK